MGNGGTSKEEPQSEKPGRPVRMTHFETNQAIENGTHLRPGTAMGDKPIRDRQTEMGARANPEN